jgi:hypothetical protein
MQNITMMILTSTAVFGFAIDSHGAESQGRVEKKTITVINAESTADGSTQIGREAMKECIVTLPKPESLEPNVVSDSKYLKEINGEAGKNDWVRFYTAKLTVNYMVNRNDLLIVATKSIEGRDPTMKEVEKYLPRSHDFESNPANGDTYGGRSNRQYYFTKQEDAVKDVRSQVLVWLKQQTPLLCPEAK